MNIAIVFGNKRNNSNGYIQNILNTLTSRGINVFADECYTFELKDTNVNFVNYEELYQLGDVILAVGGDGTIIHVAKEASQWDKPVMGINSGRLGFLASMEQNQPDMLLNLINGEYEISKRMMLEVDIDGKKILALNDISINRALDSPIVDYSVRNSNFNIFKYRSDGIIVATPTGSTAYALSAGGPVIDSSLECIEITPICAHCVSPKSIVLSAKDDIFVNYSLKENSEIFVLVDGNICAKKDLSGCLSLKKSKRYANFIVLKNRNFYKNINKLINN